ncbi:MAG: hypothetical protein R3C20_03215 [Planctomycetaceae bacterium]
MAIELFAGDWGNGMRCSYLRYKALKLHLLVAACTMSGLLSPAHAGSELEDLCDPCRVQNPLSGRFFRNGTEPGNRRYSVARNDTETVNVLNRSSRSAISSKASTQYSVDVPIYR